MSYPFHAPATSPTNSPTSTQMSKKNSCSGLKALLEEEQELCDYTTPTTIQPPMTIIDQLSYYQVSTIS